MSVYSHLSLEERGLISLYHDKGLSKRAIGRQLCRPASCISREIAKNSNKEAYKADTAQRRYLARRHSGRLLDIDTKLSSFVIEKLQENWTPEQIAGRLRNYPEKDLRTISHEAIYQWLYEPNQKKQKLYRLLPRAHWKRARRKRVHRSLIKNRQSIYDRPSEVDLRNEAGHWEADLISCRRGSQHILVMVERKTRYTASVKLRNKTSDETIQALIKICRALPTRLRKSITFDNGGEFAKHLRLCECFNIQTWFCDPYKSWQKGSVENINGRLRRDIPRKMNLLKVSDEEIEQIIITHNLTPRKILGYRTPMESLLFEMGKNVSLIFQKGVALRS
jgi:IS30 family transposase|tara:strand:+ start:72 stop:1076 length:1005 start_codon:yes stop_codon:yes gene_type:complete